MRARRFLLYMVLAGLLARVIYLSQVAALPFFDFPVGDSARYLDRAREILDGRLAGDRPFFYGGIFYPWLLALEMLLFGSSFYPVCLLQAGVGCVLAFVLYRFALAAVPPEQSATGRTLGLLAAGLALFYGPFAFLEADLLMISWTLLLVMSASLLLLAAIARRGATQVATRSGAAGVCLALAATERPNLILLLPLLAGWSFAYAGRRLRAAAAGALIAGGALVVLAVAGLNHAACRRWVPLTTSAGINFYIGNHAGARGTYDEPWSESDPEFAASHHDLEEASLTMARRLSGRDLDAADASSFWLAKGVGEIRADPAAAVRLAARKLMLFWSAEEIPNHLDFAFLRTAAPALWLMPLSFAFVAPLGLYGLAAAGARRLLSRPALVLLGLLVAAPAASVIPFFVADRYRIVVVPPLIVLSACGAVALWRLLMVRLTRRTAFLHLCCVVLAGAAMTQSSRALRQTDTSRNYRMMAQAYMRLSDLDAAERQYARALEISPDDALLHNGLGVVYERMGNFERAEAEYRAAVRLAPRLRLPHRNLGLILMRHGPAREEEACENLLAAESADPEDLDVARALVAILWSRGDAEGARRRALFVLQRAPDDPSAVAVVARTGGPPAH